MIVSDKFYLCKINVKAGSDDDLLKYVKDYFGEDYQINLVAETADIYVSCLAIPDALKKMSTIKTNSDVLGIEIEVIHTHYYFEKPSGHKYYYISYVTVDNSDGLSFLNSLLKNVEDIGGNFFDIIFAGEIFSTKYDVVFIFGSNSQWDTVWDLNKQIRAIDGIVDTLIYTFRDVKDKLSFLRIP